MELPEVLRADNELLASALKRADRVFGHEIPVWNLTSDQAGVILDLALKRLVDARRAYLDEPTTREWNETIDKLFIRLQLAMVDFVNAFHVAETVANIVDDMRIDLRVAPYSGALA